MHGTDDILLPGGIAAAELLGSGGGGIMRSMMTAVNFE